MIYEIGADRIMFVHRERDFQFRPNAIDAGHKNRLTHSCKIRAKQSAEAADFAEHLRPMRSPNECLNLAFQSIAKIDINARARVSLVHNGML